ncbi:ubiquinol-cytochrome-c reductase complex assembly factor 3-like [Antedon mediterranea]|uniref:ubiquinol-cytochrome-c reductase complex assembly factor 3-like n=1 Tax=Antedon mediterranea TaxID=105859 RepID=UPI003AF607CA
MSKLYKVLTVGVTVGGSGFLAWGLMQAITPTREQMLEVLPEKNPEYMTASRKRSQEFLDVIKLAAETDKPVYRDGIGVISSHIKKD